MTHDNNNILYAYGPHTKADSIKMELLVALSSLDNTISEEKILGQHIKINHLATPYKAAVLYAIKTTVAFRTQVLASHNPNDLSALHQKFLTLKNHLEFEMSLAYQKTQELVVHLQSMVNLSNIKNQLKADVRTKVTQAIKADDTIQDDSKKQALKQKIATLIKKNKYTTQSELLQKDLLHSADCLLKGDVDGLRNHFYFEKHPEYFEAYNENMIDLSDKSIKIMLNIYAKKITTPKENNFDNLNPQTIFDMFMTFFTKIFYVKKINTKPIVNADKLKNYIEHLNKSRANKSTDMKQIQAEKNTVYVNLQHYLKQGTAENINTEA
jgi:hypothetical protein